MFCGNFSHGYDDDPWSLGSPKRSRKREKNPYSNRGLDKFSSVLADLEARREKIMAQIGEVSLIRFMYSNSHDWVPIVVRLRDPKLMKTKITNSKDQPSQQNLEAVAKSTIGSVGAKEGGPEASTSNGKMKKTFSWSLNNGGGLSSKWRSNYYWPMALILILLCLLMFGRSFAILCTSIWWYLVPTLKGGDVNARRSRKDYVRRLSEKRLGGDVKSPAPKMGAMEVSSPRHHVNGRK
ncbi:uncharacterized protein LOC131218938 [Magnolia sinica]|uniref:uncharacterized protein LOC131218938 n=1 Tax=Magnolia sinica TaxID=86752 RepID=UPI0026599920|nr:uncharacterized protein LOC131218938 [Magnolia sinica]